MRKNSRSADPPPRIVLCAGLKSSGSTWLYNVVVEILRAHAPSGVRPFYADNFAMFPRQAERARFLVIKCHEPSKSVLFLAKFLGGKIFVTVREPRDAIASLMQRFHHAFEPSLKDVVHQAACMMDLSRQKSVTIFRYEDGFTEELRTIDEVADILNLNLRKSVRERIFRSLTREAVREKIGALKKTGKFGLKPNADSFDPRTHWHPGHLGDGKIGKYRSILTVEQQKAIIAVTRPYRTRFGYLRARKR